MTTADEIRAWTTANRRAVRAYARESRCADCGTPKATNTATRCRACTSRANHAPKDDQ